MPYLTKRESEILYLAGEGMSARQIADMLFCSRRTVEFHMANLYTKLHVSNRVQALKRAGSLGLLDSLEYSSPGVAEISKPLLHFEK
ncbi:helix-turn-helix transcriptional regulator [bacterium]|nr:helix-turn-helix transcriptional regulator [bacterium]